MTETQTDGQLERETEVDRHNDLLKYVTEIEKERLIDGEREY